MRCRLGLLLAGLMLTQTVSVRPFFAADPPAGGGAAASPNAAVIYWQAFAALPTLEGEQKTQYEAAIKTTTEPVSDNLQPIVARFDNALREMHRARGVATCDWNLNYDDGPGLLLPHLQKARELSRAALLRARLRFAAQATDEALADVVAVLKMARDCGSSPLLVSLLVDMAIENMATEVLAANLVRLAPQQLDGLAAALKTLPATPSVVDCMQLEGQIFGDWMERFIDAEAAKLDDPQAGGKVLAALFQQMNGGSPPDANEADAAQRRKLLESLTVADVRESLRRLRADYAQSAKIAGLPSAERRGRWNEFESQLAETPEVCQARRRPAEPLSTRPAGHRQSCRPRRPVPRAPESADVGHPSATPRSRHDQGRRGSRARAGRVPPDRRRLRTPLPARLGRHAGSASNRRGQVSTGGPHHVQTASSVSPSATGNSLSSVSRASLPSRLTVAGTVRPAMVTVAWAESAPAGNSNTSSRTRSVPYRTSIRSVCWLPCRLGRTGPNFPPC